MCKVSKDVLDYRKKVNMSRIISEQNDNAVVGGFTAYDGESLSAFIETSSKGASVLVVNRDGNQIALSGRDARALYRLLATHYNNVVTS